MDVFSEFLKEVLKGIVRAISAQLLQKTFLNKEKTTRSRDKQKGGSLKNNYLTTTACTAEAVEEG